MQKDLKNLLKISKKIVKKSTFKKLKKIKDKTELIETTKYSIISSLEQEQFAIEKEIKKLEGQKKDVFFIKNKALLIPSKIKHFKINFSKREFYKVFKLLNDIKKEITCLTH